jgi:hypothetical protein
LEQLLSDAIKLKVGLVHSALERRCPEGLTMRCYFNLVHTIPDEDGVEVADLDEARALAAEAITELIANGENEIADWRGWHIAVTDGSGTIAFTIRLDRPLT